MIQLSPASIVCLLAWIVGLVLLVMWGQTFRERHRNMMGQMGKMFAVSGIFLIVAIVSLCTKGLNKGLDFTGGTIVEVAAYHDVTVEEVQGVLNDFKSPPLGDKVVQIGADHSTDQDGKPYQRVVVRVTRADTGNADESKQLHDKEPDALFDALKAKLGPTDMKQLRVASIGPTISNELKKTAATAVLAALLVQCGYIFLRFGGQLRFGVAADIAIIHDVLIMVGLYSLSGRQLDSPFVAALLTVAGYSVMDSVVIFDRIRENNTHNDALPVDQRKPFPEVVNDSVNQTMTRSINTTMTVIITLLAIYFFGGDTLQNFAFALLIGITSGAYSSICIASPLLILIDRKFGHKGPRESTEEDEELDPVDAELARQAVATRRRRRGPNAARPQAVSEE